MNKSEKFWDRVSSKSKSEPNASAKKVIQCTKPFLNTNQIVLDFGCGPGTITNRLSAFVKKMDAIDLSKGMIDFAKQQAKVNSILNIEYAQNSIFDPCFKEHTYDVILSFNVLHYIEDMPALMERINKLLKPNGYFISSTACLRENRNGVRALLWMLQQLKIMPKMMFYQKSELENALTAQHFDLVESALISSLPEYFLIGKKMN